MGKRQENRDAMIEWRNGLDGPSGLISALMVFYDRVQLGAI